jgi:small subunit ribosomal protein S5
MGEFFNGGDFEEKIVQVNRVAKKTAGGNKIGFSVLVVVGNKKGQVGVGLGKAPTVADAIRKGIAYAKKHLIWVPMVETTIPHAVYLKRGAAKVLLKPASKGTGVIAGGAVRAVVEAAGIRDILSKVLGTSNQASNVYATLEALKCLKLASGQKEDRKAGKQEATIGADRAGQKEEAADKSVEKPANKRNANSKEKSRKEPPPKKKK